MNKNLQRTLIAISVLSLSSLTYAAKTGGYVGGGLGLSNLDTPKQMLGDGEDLNGFATSRSNKRGGLGERIFTGYNFNQYAGLELGYGHYASSINKFNANGVVSGIPLSLNSKTEYSLYDFDLVGKGYLPLAETGIDLYALAGLAYVRSKSAITVSGSAGGETMADHLNVTTNKFRPKYGMGVQYNVPSLPVTASFELSRIQGTGKVKSDDVAEGKHSIPSANMMMLSVAYNFG